MKYIDLHVHTYYSDGTDSPLQVIRTGKMRGLDLIAISDHDTLDGYFRGISEAKKINIPLIPAVEITTMEAHILGLNFNPLDVRLKKFIKYSQEVHDEVCFQRIEKLQKAGVPISFEKVRKAFPHSSLGKYSILWTMLLDDDCRKYLDIKQRDFSFQNLMKIYLSRDGIAGKVEKRRAIYWHQAVEEIKKAGGLVIFPHPGKSGKSPSEVMHLIKDVDGIEIQPKYAQENILFEDYAKRNNLLVVYGSDYHSMYGGSPILGKGMNQIDDNFAKLLLRKH
jgi:predicted metal-dependent phosphoesterase TrpH